MNSRNSVFRGFHLVTSTYVRTWLKEKDTAHCVCYWLFNLSNRLSAVSSFSLGNWPPTIIVLPIVGIGSYLAPFKPWQIQDRCRLQMSQPSYP